MNDKPLISVIIIFLNEEKFIQEAIESVLAQTYDSWELILVDDGSTDGSADIVQGYVEKYTEKIRCFEHKGRQNLGMSASRNLGISHANGDYVAILDADDVWSPKILKEQVGILESHPQAALVYGPVLRWYSWTGNPEDIYRDSVRELGVLANSLVRPPALLKLLLQDQGMPSGFLVRREVIDRVGGYEEAFRGVYEDNAFLAKICLTEPVYASAGRWYKYRKHPDSVCAVAVDTGRYQSARLAFLNWVKVYLSKQGVKNSEVWEALQKELWPYHHPGLHSLKSHAQHYARQMKNLLKRIA